MSCPIFDDLVIEQNHPDYPDPQMGDEWHGQYDPDGDMSELNYDPDDEVYR
jgi:hypothetical protein